MNRYLKLVNFEFTRFRILFLILMGITAFFQMVGVVFEARKYVNRANQAIYEDSLSVADFIGQFGKMSFYQFAQTLWFLGPIVICGVTLLIYVFFIWYRDWLGKNTFSYRLLVLPTARMNLYLSKATTLIIFVLGLVALQLVIIPIEVYILKSIIPTEFYTDFSINEVTNLYILNILYPKTFIDFILFYGAGMASVCIVFTAILFERSYRLKGILFGILYCAASLFLLLTPVLVNEFILGNYFYPIELFYMEVGIGLLVWAAAIWMGNYLLNNKIRV